MNSQNSPFSKDAPSMRRAFIVLEVNITDDLTNNLAHDGMLRAVDDFVEDATADGVPCELVGFHVVEDLKDLTGLSNVAGVEELSTQRSGIAESVSPHFLKASDGRPETLEQSPQPPGRTVGRAGGETTSEACSAPRFFMWRVCSRCHSGQVFGTKACAPEDHLKKTHGLCEFHQAEAIAEVNRLRSENFFRSASNPKAEPVIV